MKTSQAFIALAAIAGLAAAGGCATQNASPHGPLLPAVSATPASQPYTPTPPPSKLYVDHNGTLYEYALPLHAGSKPYRTLAEEAGAPLPPQVSVDKFGRVAIATTSEVRIFDPPIVSLARSAARTIVPLNPGNTQILSTGADLVDLEFDPNENLWLISGGGEISMLRPPFNKNTEASVFIPFGAPGTKTASFGVVQARFDVGATLYVYGQAATFGQLFKTSFPYSKPLSPTGLNVAQAAFVDSTQFLPTDPNPVTVIVGQYVGALSSPPPQQPPPQPVNMLAQFAEPLNPLQGLFPDATAKSVVGALAADPPATRVFTLTASTGRLDVYPLPLPPAASPLLSLRCLGGVKNCNAKPEHLFLAP